MTDQKMVSDVVDSGDNNSVNECSSKPSDIVDTPNLEKDDTNREGLNDGSNSNVPVSTAAISTAQKVFGGKSNIGTDLKCSNLRNNPFSLSSERFTATSSILAKPKFSLKPSSFGGQAEARPPISEPSDRTSLGGASLTSNAFLRPATLNYDSDDQETAENKSTGVTTQPEGSPSESTQTTTDAPESGEAGLKDLASSNNGTSTSLLGASSEIMTVGQTLGVHNNLAHSSSSFVFGEGLNDRVTNVAKENGTANGHSEAGKPKAKTLEEAADEYKKQQVCHPHQ